MKENEHVLTKWLLLPLCMLASCYRIQVYFHFHHQYYLMAVGLALPVFYCILSWILAKIHKYIPEMNMPYSISFYFIVEEIFPLSYEIVIEYRYVNLNLKKTQAWMGFQCSALLTELSSHLGAGHIVHHVFISFSEVKLYDLSYIHFHSSPSTEGHLFLFWKQFHTK